MTKKVSIHEIADYANVSTATVSRVFAFPEKVQDDTRLKVQKICEKYEYKPRVYHKRHQQTTHELFIAIVVADLNNIFFQEIIQNIKKELNRHNISLAIFDSRESAACELLNLNILENLQVNGMFISPISEKTDINTEILKSFYRKGVPVILLDRDIKGFGLDGVFQDNYSGAYDAVNTFLKNGHQHIATIAGPINSNPGIDRLNGYIDALKSHDIPIRQEYILYGDNMKESGYRLTKQLLNRYPEITAIFSANNLMSIGSLQAIKETGLVIPQDIAFISTGSLQAFDIYGDLNITELLQPTEAIGEECANLMINRLSNPLRSRTKGPAKRITYDMSLLLKGSEIFPENKKAIRR